MVQIEIFLDEDDLYKDRSMPEYIMRYLMHNNIAGATIFDGLVGYGHKHHLHFPKKIGNVDEHPFMIMFIDEEEKVNAVLPHLKEIIKEGLIVKIPAQII